MLFELIRLYFQCKVNIAKTCKILVKINTDIELLKKEFNCLVNVNETKLNHVNQ